MRLLPLWAALWLALPCQAAQGKAQVRTQGGQSAGASAAAPSSLAPIPTLSPGLSATLSGPGAPALAPSVAPSALPSLPASAVSAQGVQKLEAGAAAAPSQAPRAEAAAAPPGPPSGGETASAGGGGGPPRFVQSLVSLGVPLELALELAKAGPSGALADKVAAALESDPMPARSKIILIAAAALRAPEPLLPFALIELGARFGFRPAQVQALAVTGTAEESDRALRGAFRGLELDWALSWGPRLAQSAALFESKVKDDGRMLAAAERAASELQGREGPSVDPQDLAAAKRYIAGIIGRDIKPTPKQLEGLVTLFLEEEGIAPSSPRALALKRALIPEAARAEEQALASISPSVRKYGGAILKVAKENGVTPAEVEAVIKKRGLTGMLAAATPEQLERVLDTALERERLEGAVSGYPDSEQGRLMRDVVAHMMARSGKSVEEIARDGVFVYADFNGGRVLRAWSGRDPDTKAPGMVFYFTFHDGKWKVAGYRQNRQLGRTDASLIEGLLVWLESGGVPRSDFLN